MSEGHIGESFIRTGDMYVSSNRICELGIRAGDIANPRDDERPRHECETREGVGRISPVPKTCRKIVHDHHERVGGGCGVTARSHGSSARHASTGSIESGGHLSSNYIASRGCLGWGGFRGKSYFRL